MDDADLVPLSALQHYLYCPRQCALIHIEQAWTENRFTAEGRLLHDRTHNPATETRRGVRTVTAMPIKSQRLGVVGVADVVELVEREGKIAPFPIEYKRGRPKSHRADEVQLCAQAFALEEMFATDVAEGALFYGATRRRLPVTFDAELRALTERVARETRALIASERLPRMAYERARCSACSLIETCRPKIGSLSARDWLTRMVASED